MKGVSSMAKPKRLYTYADIALWVGVPRNLLQACVKRCQKKQPGRFMPDDTIITGRALTHAFYWRMAQAIKTAWLKEGPGRKK